MGARKSFGPKMRYRLMKGQRGRCYYCRKAVTIHPDLPNTITVEHIIPLSRGGTNRQTNLVGACYICNQDKGSKTGAEYYLPKKEPAQ